MSSQQLSEFRKAIASSDNFTIKEKREAIVEFEFGKLQGLADDALKREEKRAERRERFKWAGAALGLLVGLGMIGKLFSGDVTGGEISSALFFGVPLLFICGLWLKRKLAAIKWSIEW